MKLREWDIEDLLLNIIIISQIIMIIMITLDFVLLFKISDIVIIGISVVLVFQSMLIIYYVIKYKKR